MNVERIVAPIPQPSVIDAQLPNWLTVAALPELRVVEAELPTILIETSLPAVPVVRVPNSWIPALKSATASFMASGSLMVDVVIGAQVAAPLNASGQLSVAARPKALAAAQLTGEGSLAITAFAYGGQFTRPAGFSGAGSASVQVRVSYPRTAELSGAGTLSVATVPRIARTANFGSAGTLGSATAVLADVTLTGAGGLSVVAQQAKVPMGMNKVGAQQIPGDTNNSAPLFPRSTKVRGWTVRAGNPNTVIVDDSLKSTAAMTVNFTGKVSFEVEGLASAIQFMIVKNNAEVVSIGNTGATLSGTAALAPNDTLSLYAWGSAYVSSAYRNVIETNTFLYWTPI
ncbi:hypothetical protein [Prescottella agglutinans]|uniref:Minor tail protein n=1 Tax=Prescottella agglutinans TaxID=1644129 RepID=A0ABT6M4V1_9NOCA|nr:hypothetical protein [Prescottella agglutinans]MDH6279327.1 hypothetical protein [Prescottella agglutinans]